MNRNAVGFVQQRQNPRQHRVQVITVVGRDYRRTNQRKTQVDVGH
jgi:hypothetical protein